MVFELGFGKMSLCEIAAAVGANGVFSAISPKRVVTDSREIENGDIFCALRGAKDGHDYVKEASARGALAVIAERKTAASLPHILTENTLGALEKWAKEARKRASNCRFIAVTGSVGKTTTKEALAKTLSARYHVFVSKENYNNALGVSLSLLSVPKESEIAVLELGSNAKGEIEHLSRIVSPDDAIITCIGHAHVGAFGCLEKTAEEKLGILKGLREKGTLYIKNEDPYLKTVPQEGVRTVKVNASSLSEDTAVAYALGFAEAIGKDRGLSDNQLKAGLNAALQSDVRRKTEVIRDVTLIDDGYNASPESMLSAFSLLKRREGKRKILVIGDMLELGIHATRLHQEIGYAAAFADIVFAFGSYAPVYRNAIEKTKKNTVHLLKATTPKEQAEEILPLIKEGDAILFKASHALRADKVARELSNLLKR